jgi:alpha-galactosidase
MRSLLGASPVVAAALLTFASSPGLGVELRWKLATQDTEIELGVADDAPAVVGLRSPGVSWNWAATPNREALPKSVTQAGKAHSLRWRHVGHDYDAAKRTLTLTFRSDAPALELKSVWKAPAGRGPIEHWQTLKNATSDRITIDSQPSLKLDALAVPFDKYVESTQVLRGGSAAPISGGTITQPVGRLWVTNVPSRPSDAGKVDFLNEDLTTQVPFLNLQVSAEHGLYVGWMFSGVGEINAVASGQMATPTRDLTIALSAGLLADFRTDLFPGEEFLVPPAFIGTYRGVHAAGTYSLHRYILDSLLPRIPSGVPFPQLGYNLYFDGGQPGTQTEADVLVSAKRAHELGFETYVADAMWFPQTGDWRWDPMRFPRGPKPIADFLHANGMRFGLWMSWSQAANPGAPDSALKYEAHPDWFTHPPIYAKKGEGVINWQAQIDVGHPGAREWVERETQRVVREYGVDFLKTDFSPIAIKSEAQRDRGHHKTDVSYWSTLGYYRIQEALLGEFPHLLLEGCSMGGKIKDFGNSSRVHTFVGTDTLSAMADRQSVYDTTFMFPPATIQLYTYENVYSPVADAPEPYLWRSAMMGMWMLALTESEKLTQPQKAQIRRSTDIYKSWLRPVMLDAQVFRVLPRPNGLHWDGMFYWNAGIRKGTLYVFRPNAERSRQMVYLQGLEPSASYRIRSEDGSIAAGVHSGATLMIEGVVLELSKKFTSDIVYVEAAG